MAETGYGCVFGDCTQQVAHIITDITNGASVSLCAEHYGPGMIPLLAAELGIEPMVFYADVERILAREAKKAAKAVADAQAAQAAEGSAAPSEPPADSPPKGEENLSGAVVRSVTVPGPPDEAA